MLPASCACSAASECHSEPLLHHHRKALRQGSPLKVWLIVEGGAVPQTRDHPGSEPRDDRLTATSASGPWEDGG